MTNRRTNRGVPIDLDALIGTKEKQIPAVGNMKVNAQGDVLGPAGKVIMRNEERVRNYYRNTKTTTVNTSLNTARPKPSALQPDVAPEPQPPDEFEPPNMREVELPNGDIEMVPILPPEPKPKRGNLA